MVSTEDHIEFEIQAKDDFKVYINNHNVTPNESDRLQYKLELKKLGKQSIAIKFVNQNDSFVVVRNLIKLKNPKQTAMQT